MIKLLLLLVALTTTVLVNAHRICIDSTTPKPMPIAPSPLFSVCTSWNTRKLTCVQPSDESTQVVEPEYDEINAPPTSTCRNLLKAVSCAKVDEWAGHLYRSENNGLAPPESTEVPMLCSTFCKSVFNACKDTQMRNFPFVNNSATFTTISQVYGAKFCSKFAFDPQYCFVGSPFTLPPAPKFKPSSSLCVEKVLHDDNDYIPKASFQPVPGHPDLLMIGDLMGQVKVFQVNNNKTGTPFVLKGLLLDISSEVEFGGEMGLLGVAFHKNFASNGRFYVSYSCSQAGFKCNYMDSIVDEFRVDNPANPDELQANLATRRRIFNVTQPYENHNGGQLLFSPDPDEPNLFLMLGDGGSGGDPGNRAVSFIHNHFIRSKKTTNNRLYANLSND
jgi:hypothetical protein